jgi:hypothetical protein
LTVGASFAAHHGDFAGLFGTKEEAEARAKQLGPEYELRYGDNREGTDDFISTSIG